MKIDVIATVDFDDLFVYDGDSISERLKDEVEAAILRNVRYNPDIKQLALALSSRLVEVLAKDAGSIDAMLEECKVKAIASIEKKIGSLVMKLVDVKRIKR